MNSRESREITLRNARNKIKALGNQLSLRQDRIDMAFNFFRMALTRNLTRGRKSTHVIAACVYITCRTEGTSHMLIDLSDILQIDVYELGRTYLRLSQELCINIPAMDPCLYVMRFAHKLEFAEKTHEVSMTALRLVSRMKKDWIHLGRRPSGLCGAALLIAARLHRFNRTVSDVIRVVKVHESTLRKRLNEFGETPASALTLDEFMNVDLDAMTEEQDPPSFKAARRKDRLRMLELEESDIEEQMGELQGEIERQLLETRAKMKGRYAREARMAIAEQAAGLAPSTSAESADANRFITEQTMGTIQEIVSGGGSSSDEKDKELMPPPKKGVVASPGLGLKDTIQEYLATPSTSKKGGDEKDPNPDSGADSGDELDLTGIDEDEIDSYLMTDKEIKCKTDMWMRVNAEYLKEKAEKEERERREEEEAIREGREIKKKKKAGGGRKQKINLGGNQTAMEAIEKIVQEKKISTKINYDVLRSLNMGPPGTPSSSATPSEPPQSPAAAASPAVTTPDKDSIASPKPGPSSTKEEKTDPPAKTSKAFAPTPKESTSPSKIKRRKNSETESPSKKRLRKDSEPIVESGPVQPIEEEDEEALGEEEEEEEEVDESCMSAAQLLSRHLGDNEEEFYEEEYD